MQVEKSMSDLLSRIAKLHDAAVKLGFTHKDLDDETKARSLTRNYK